MPKIPLSWVFLAKFRIPSQRGPMMKKSLSTTKKLVEESVVVTCVTCLEKMLFDDIFMEIDEIFAPPCLLFGSSGPRGRRPSQFSYHHKDDNHQDHYHQLHHHYHTDHYNHHQNKSSSASSCTKYVMVIAKCSATKAFGLTCDPHRVPEPLPLLALTSKIRRGLGSTRAPELRLRCRRFVSQS